MGRSSKRRRYKSIPLNLKRGKKKGKFSKKGFLKGPTIFRHQGLIGGQKKGRIEGIFITENFYLFFFGTPHNKRVTFFF